MGIDFMDKHDRFSFFLGHLKNNFMVKLSIFVNFFTVTCWRIFGSFFYWIPFFRKNIIQVEKRNLPKCLNSLVF